MKRYHLHQKIGTVRLLDPTGFMAHSDVEAIREAQAHFADLARNQSTRVSIELESGDGRSILMIFADEQPAECTAAF